MSSPAIWTHPLCWRWNRSSRSNRWQRNLRLPKPRVGARARRIIHLSRSEPVKLSDRRIPVGERSAETNPDGRRWDTNLRREGTRAKKRTRSDRISTKIGFIHKLSAGEVGSRSEPGEGLARRRTGRTTAIDIRIEPPTDSVTDQIAPISRQVWDAKYCLKDSHGTPIDLTVEDTWHRVARALAQPETDAGYWERRFYTALEDFRFLPAGRILSGAGTQRRVTLFNCFVMGDIADDLGSIFAHLREAALTMQQGGGIGYDFSTLRPKGAPVRGVGADASGPLSFMDVWDAMCRTIMSAGARRGAMMATMRCDHPDIEDFIAAKRQAGRLRNFNLSVLATDPFMAAVQADADWELVFAGKVYKVVRAKALFDSITRATYNYAEPGVIFIDQINTRNRLAYCETIRSTNPCGEQPLPP